MRSLTASHRGHADRAASVCSRLKKFQTGSKDTRGHIPLDHIQAGQIHKKRVSKGELRLPSTKHFNNKDRWFCLEVGGRCGSIASCLYERVGDEGRVLATDIEPRFLEALSFRNLHVLGHDTRMEGLRRLRSGA